MSMTKLTLKRRMSDWLRGTRASALHFEAMENPPEESCQAVYRGLVAYNQQFIGVMDHTPVGSFVRDDTGRIRGGATGKIGWGWLTLDLLWIDENLRGTGVGSRLLAQIERLALKRGIYRFKVSTASFQALDFYKTNGYELYATLEDHPPGHTDYSLKKVIDLAGGD